jgi:hypothetical protein
VSGSPTIPALLIKMSSSPTCSAKTNWVLDADIRSFCDTVDHEWLKQFIEHRIGDKRVLRLLMKWLHAGVMEDGELHEVADSSHKNVLPASRRNTREVRGLRALLERPGADPTRSHA